MSVGRFLKLPDDYDPATNVIKLKRRPFLRRWVNHVRCYRAAGIPRAKAIWHGFWLAAS